ncbi:MAG: hypothetical protein PGN12_06130 [Sphingomonas phyllosphaerae]
MARDGHASQQAGWSAHGAAIVLNSFVNDVFPTIGPLPISAPGYRYVQGITQWMELQLEKGGIRPAIYRKRQFR